EEEEAIEDQENAAVEPRQGKLVVPRKLPHTTGQRRKERPPQDDPCQHAARAITISPAAGGNLKQAVGYREGAKHKTHGRMRDVQIPLDRRCRLADANAVDVKHKRKGTEKSEYAVARACGTLMRLGKQGKRRKIFGAHWEPVYGAARSN